MLEFIDNKNGYIVKNKKKEEFIKRNMEFILKYYKIVDKKGWKVESCIVLSDDNVVRYILEGKFKIITYFDIKKYASKY